jgi:hypothetical protein
MNKPVNTEYDPIRKLMNKLKPMGREDIIQALKGRKISWLGLVWESNGIKYRR